MATPIGSGRRAAGRCGLRPTGSTLRGLPRDQDLHHFLGHQHLARLIKTLQQVLDGAGSNN